jgi:pimeloyl-ACP methyl ester carboxylesterase
MSSPRKIPDRGRSSVRVRLVTAILCMALGCGLYVCLRPFSFLLTMVQIRLGLGGIRSEYTPVDGQSIHYYVGGSGKPVVLVHGLGGRAEDWMDLMPRLVRAGYRVYALDLLGYGRSARPENAAYSIPEEAGIVEDFAASQHLSRIDLVGWSMGGWIAQRVALDRPALVRRLVVCGSAGLRFDLPYATDILLPDTPGKLIQLYTLLSSTKDPLPVPAFLRRDLLGLLRRNRWIIKRSLDSMLTGQDVLDNRLSALKMPVLIVWGNQDKLIPVSVGYAMHKAIPQSVLSVYDGCGHLAPEECGARVGPDIVRFLSAEPALTGAARVSPQ